MTVRDHTRVHGPITQRDRDLVIMTGNIGIEMTVIVNVVKETATDITSETTTDTHDKRLKNCLRTRRMKYSHLRSTEDDERVPLTICQLSNTKNLRSVSLFTKTKTEITIKIISEKKVTSNGNVT